MLALVARKAVPSVRWTAYSNGFHTRSCSPRRGADAYCYPRPPLFHGMDRGDLLKAVQRTRWSGGLKEVRTTWGCGLRAITAEAQQYSIPATGAAA